MPTLAAALLDAGDLDSERALKASVEMEDLIERLLRALIRVEKQRK